MRSTLTRRETDCRSSATHNMPRSVSCQTTLHVASLERGAHKSSNEVCSTLVQHRWMQDIVDEV